LELQDRETPLNAFLAELEKDLPALAGSITDVSGILTDFEVGLADATGEQTTYNQLGQPCTEYTVIFARGTTEPGNVGIVAGPPFFNALDSIVGSSSVTIQGVNNYAASVEGYLEGGDPTGSKEMASLISEAVTNCPNTNLIVSGYSQGGQLVHNSISELPAATAKAIDSVVIFGDPYAGVPIPNVPSSKVLTICHLGDDICIDGDLVLPPHLTYGLNAVQAADFVTRG
ncbi:hypothetical protein DH86_00003452, partial [Scytalidium sp. 3C]